MNSEFSPTPTGIQSLVSDTKTYWARYRPILRAWGSVLVLILLCLFIGMNNSNFFQTQNFIRISRSATLILLLAIGETFVIMLGSIDLSVEGVAALSAVSVSLIGLIFFLARRATPSEPKRDNSVT